MIKIEHLKKAYPNAAPLKDVSVEIRDGDVISVIGPSGTGKSTLLRCINLLEKPTEGHIWVDGVDVTDPKCDLGKVRQKMGMVFQSFNLFGHLTVIENIMLAPVDLLGKSRQEACDEGIRLLRTVGLAEKALNYPDELSGGQKQRIAIARTLAMNPDIIPTLNIVNKDDRYQAIAHIYAAGVYVADHVLQGHSMKAISLSLRMTDSLYLINVDSRIDIVSISNMSSAIDELLTSWIDSVEGNKIIYRITNALVSAFLLGVMTYI